MPASPEPAAPPFIIGVDIGGTKCAVAKSTRDGQILAHETFPTESMARTVALILEAVERLQPGGDPLFGVACGSPQDSARGIIQAPPNLPDWVDVPIIDHLTGRFGGQGWLMNDANACALAEWFFGAGVGTRHMIYLTFGTGLGGGLILNGRLYAGACDNAGEVGHFRLAEDGPVGVGKAGSFEGFCSGGGIAQRARDWARARAAGADDRPVTAREVAAAADQGDPGAIAIFTETGRRLGQGLALIIDMLNPEMIVLGSIYVRCRHLLEQPMMEVLRREALGPSLAACRIVPAALGENLGICSAIAVARYHLGNLPPASA
ncbi:MAG TPA: ROK family protein [Candidatus Sumerlaeota bacterium]|nr:ROK family protein [Candidatus Sumerlaeota bacterium]